MIALLSGCTDPEVVTVAVAPATDVELPAPSTTTTTEPLASIPPTQRLPGTDDEILLIAHLDLEVELNEVEPHVGDWVGRDWTTVEPILPIVTYGVPGVIDPFERDLQLATVAWDHDSTEFLRDPGFGEHEGELGGRPVLWQQWYLDYDTDPAGFEILWDASDELVVHARTRELPIEEALRLVGTATVDSETGAILENPPDAGLAPVLTDTLLQFAAGEDYWRLKSGLHAEYYVEDPDDYADLDIWLIDGSDDDLNLFRFLAGQETAVPIRGTTGYLLDKVQLKWNHDAQPVLVWREDAERVGIATVDELRFADALPDLVDRFDEGSLEID